MSLDDLYPDLHVRLDPAAPDGRQDVTDALLVPARGSRSSPVFNAHSYHTKVPPEAIEPYIAHHTQPGAVVLDPFAGSGMTGVAARRLGRRAILNDLSPAAAHIAWNVTHACDPAALGVAAARALAAVANLHQDLYRAACGGCRDAATVAFTIWSDRLACRMCGTPISIWEHGTNRSSGVVRPTLVCPSCDGETVRRGAIRVDTRPAWVVTDCVRCGRVERPVGDADFQHEARWRATPIADWYPKTPIGADREMYIRSALGARQIRTVADFYTARNLHALSALWASIGDEPDLRLRQVLALAFTNTAWHGTVMRRYNARGGQRPLTGTLYIPHLSSEVNVGKVFAHKIRQLQTFYRAEWRGVRAADAVNVIVGSATRLGSVPDRSIDYVFTDPPFGSNIFYADCNLIWESWLGKMTDRTDEVVVNRSLKVHQGGKTVADYEVLMRGSFTELARVLRRDAWMTVVFHSTDAAVWQAIEDAATDSGLSIKGATYLDKEQLSHKGYKGRSGAEDVAAYDVVLALRNRPSTPRRAPARTKRRDDAARILREHLEELPVVGTDPASDRRRTLPYLHSLLVQHHFNGDIGLHVGGYDAVRALCTENFVSDDTGLWTIVARRREDRAQKRRPRPRLVASQHVE